MPRCNEFKLQLPTTGPPHLRRSVWRKRNTDVILISFRTQMRLPCRPEVDYSWIVNANLVVKGAANDSSATPRHD